MQKINVNELTCSPAALIGQQWMLITAGSMGQCGKDFNTMTASWGGLGFLWNRPVAYVFIRPNRHTHGFVEQSEQMTLSFMPESCREQLVFCGRSSGREVDKMAATGLSAFATEGGSVAIEGAELVLECRKLFRTSLQEADFVDWGSVSPRWYNEGDPLHDMYICEITAAWKA